MCFISPLDRDLALVYPRIAPVRLLELLAERGIEVVEVPDEEFETQGANVLALGPAPGARSRRQPRDASPDGEGRCRRRRLPRRGDLEEGRRRPDLPHPAAASSLGEPNRRLTYDSSSVELAVRREPGDADADEPQRSGTVAQPAVEQAAGDLADHARLVDRRRQGRRARPDREVARSAASPSPSGPRGPSCRGVPRRARRGAAPRRAVAPGPQMSRANVSSAETETGSSSRSRSRGSIPCARSRSSGPSEPGRSARSSASPRAGERADRVDAGRSKPRFGTWPDAREEADRERGEESRLRSRRDDRDSAGLSAVRGDLADDLRRSDAERAREARRRARRRSGSPTRRARAP